MRIISGSETAGGRAAQKFISGDPEIGGKAKGEKEWRGEVEKTKLEIGAVDPLKKEIVGGN